MKTLSQIREASGGKEAYQKFFNSLLKKYGVDSPSELKGDKKKKFFNAVDKGWEGDNPDDANEAKLHEKLKAKPGKFSGRGKDYFEIDIVIPDKWKTDEAYYKAVLKKYKVKLEYIGGPSTEYMHKASGKKSDILAWGLGSSRDGIGYGMDERDIADYFDIEQELYTERFGYNTQIIELFAKLVETYTDPDDLDPDTTHNPDEVELATEAHMPGHDDDDDEDMDDLDPDTHIDEKAPPGMEDVVKKLKADGNTDEAAFKIAWSIYNDKKRQETYYYEGKTLAEIKWGPAKKGKTIRGAKLGKSYPVMDAGQKSKVQAIAKRHSGNMQQAMIDIEKIKGGLTDNPDVMEILRLANEDVVTIHLSNILTEKLRAGKGRATMDVDMDASDYPGGDRKYMSDMKKKYKVTMKMTRSGAILTGAKADLLKFLQSDDYGMDDRDISDLFPELMEARKVKPVQGDKKEYWRRVDAVRKKFGILGKEGGILNLNKAAQKKYFAAVDAALGHTLESLDLQKTGVTGTSKSVTTEKVQVDRRTKGFKEAMLRREKAKAKREAKKAAKVAQPKYDSDSYIDKGNYEYDGDVEEVVARTKNVIIGKFKENAANAVAHGGVDMAPNAGKKKKDKFKVVKHANY
jgi:hypothetical protein